MTDWAPEELVEAHRAGSIASASYHAPFYQEIARACGVRLREGFDWLTFALMAGSAAVTASFNRKFHEELNDIMRPTGPGAALQPWSHAAILVEGLVSAAFEADPEAPVSADLETRRATG